MKLVLPFYEKTSKPERILELIFEGGNFGHNHGEKPIPIGKLA